MAAEDAPRKAPTLAGAKRPVEPTNNAPLPKRTASSDSNGRPTFLQHHKPVAGLAHQSPASPVSPESPANNGVRPTQLRRPSQPMLKQTTDPTAESTGDSSNATLDELLRHNDELVKLRVKLNFCEQTISFKRLDLDAHIQSGNAYMIGVQTDSINRDKIKRNDLVDQLGPLQLKTKSLLKQLVALRHDAATTPSPAYSDDAPPPHTDIEALRNEITSHKTAIHQELLASKDKMRDEVQQLKDQFSKATTQLRERMQDAEADAKSTKMRLQSSTVASEKELAESAKAQEKLSSDCQELQRKIETCTSENVQLRKQLADFTAFKLKAQERNDSFEDDVEKLRTELASHAENFDEKLGSYEQGMGSLQSGHDNLLSEYEDIKGRILAQAEIVDMFIAERKTNDQQTTKEPKAVSTEKPSGAELDALKAQVVHLTTGVEKASSDVKQLSDQHRSFEEHLAGLTSSYNNLQSQHLYARILDELAKRYPMKRIDELQRQLDALSKRNVPSAFYVLPGHPNPFAGNPHSSMQPQQLARTMSNGPMVFSPTPGVPIQSAAVRSLPTTPVTGTQAASPSWMQPQPQSVRPGQQSAFRTHQQPYPVNKNQQRAGSGARLAGQQK